MGVQGHVLLFADKHSPVSTENVNTIRKDLFSPLLAACDDVREQLASANIQIKVPASCLSALLLLKLKFFFFQMGPDQIFQSPVIKCFVQ